MTPTPAGRHCAACQTEIVDFTRLTEAEMLAYPAARTGPRICARPGAPPTPPKRVQGLRCWLLAAAVLLGWQPASALGLPPRELPTEAPGSGRITIRGVVLDDSLHIPVAGARLFIRGTRYGAVANERGEFSFSVALDWPPARGGQLTLEVSASHFTFQSQLVEVHFAAGQPPAPLVVRLLSIPGRGYVKGKIRLTEPPVAPPGSRRK